LRSQIGKETPLHSPFSGVVCIDMGQTLMLCGAKWATQVLWYSARMRVFYPSNPTQEVK
jgi:hypothetical protein